MTDIVERLRELADRSDVVFDPSFSWPWRESANEIERLRSALREIGKTDIQAWAKAALEKGDWAMRGYLERIAEVDQQGIALRALAGAEPRSALEDK